MSNGRYDDIIHLPRPVSKKRSPMSNFDRAAQFSPFAALTGYEETIEETARLTEDPVELDEGSVGELDEALRAIQSRIQSRPAVTIRYFCPDSRKQGGSYVTIRGRVRKIDTVFQMLQLWDGQQLPFCRIMRIEV